MGWSDCGENSLTGKPMGYAHSGTCSEEGCSEEIDHGLSYVCGNMHEGGEHGCGDYFCNKHLYYPGQLCWKCSKALENKIAEKDTR